MQLNKVLLSGNVCADPLKFDCKGGGARFTLAVKGTKEDSFIPCVVFGKTAELAVKYCTKGKAIFVEGQLTSHKDGEKTYYSVVVHNIQFLSPAVKAEKPQTEQFGS